MYASLHMIINCEREIEEADYFEVQILDSGTVLFDKKFSYDTHNFVHDQLYHISSSTLKLILYRGNESGNRYVLATKDLKCYNDDTSWTGSFEVEGNSWIPQFDDWLDIFEEGWDIFFDEDRIEIQVYAYTFEDIYYKSPTSSTAILNNTFDYSLTTAGHYRSNPMDDCFFYSDKKNLLFAEYVQRDKEVTIYEDDGVDIDDIIQDIRHRYDDMLYKVPPFVIDPGGPVEREPGWDWVVHGMRGDDYVTREDNIFTQIIDSEKTVITLDGNTYMKAGDTAVVLGEKVMEEAPGINNAEVFGDVLAGRDFGVSEEVLHSNIADKAGISSGIIDTNTSIAANNLAVNIGNSFLTANNAALNRSLGMRTTAMMKALPASPSAMMAYNANGAAMAATQYNNTFTVVLGNHDSMVEYSGIDFYYGGKGKKTFNISELKYLFKTYYHANIDEFIRILSFDGVEGFMKMESQDIQDTMNFAQYVPNGEIVFLDPEKEDIPQSSPDFQYGGAYSGYNWELFFHIPMIIAGKLSRDQKFEEAQKWYHYIFNPTIAKKGGRERFWQFKPFYKEAGNSIKTLSQLIDDDELIEKWKKNPFMPHVIARMRVSAYMKNVVMKYLDNIMAWADNLFKRDTLEAINEAVNLYIMAAKILGPKPESVPSRAKPETQTYKTLAANGTLDSLTNAMVKIEAFLPSTAAGSASDSSSSGIKALGTMLYFGMPKNDKLLEYWDKVADRLFKIRHSMNIDGVERTLPLFEPPIDPGLLVKAAAAGVDIGSVLMDVAGAARPHYRFNYVVEKARQFAEEVRTLGSSLLAAIEKHDSEELALLRQSMDQNLLEEVKEVREKQYQEALQRKKALDEALKGAKGRLDYFTTRTLTNEQEQEYLASLDTALGELKKQGTSETIAAALAAVPDFKIGSPTTVGTTFGGSNLAKATMAFASAYSSGVSENNIKGTKANAMGGFQRRLDDWQMQQASVGQEIKQLEKEIAASDIRVAITKKELENHKLQMENSRKTGEYLMKKFSSKELYDWYIGEISTLYFQAYQMAYDMAKKAQKCFEYETQDTTAYIGYGYWDSLHKGLLAAEKLIFDLNRLEAGYMDLNTRKGFELEKHVSLAAIDPQALLKIKTDGEAEFRVPEYIFDLDYPGHYDRRIKSISITIPCVAGPYTTINGTLRLKSHFTRDKIEIVQNEDYYKKAMDNEKTVSFAIGTSAGQNDSGLFELSFRDERYLPFEGCGVVSKWSLELVKDKKVRQFNYNSIGDVIIHIKYTSKENANKKADVIGKVKSYLAAWDTSNPSGRVPLCSVFSGRLEFSSQWHRFVNPVGTENSFMELPVTKELMSYLARNSGIKVKRIKLFGVFGDAAAQAGTFSFKAGGSNQSKSVSFVKLPNEYFHKAVLETRAANDNNPNSADKLVEFNLSDIQESFKVTMGKQYGKEDVSDLFIAIEYTLE